VRIERLKLERFGHFENAVLDFPERSPLAVVAGRNEAGKSTVLAAIRALLFGFPHQTPYDFRFEPSTLAIEAALAFNDGSRAELRRTKGRKNTLRGRATGGLEVDELWLERKLGNATLGLYGTVFGFSLSELASGGKNLESGQIRDAIFGGGAGGQVAPDRVLKALEEEMASLFSDRASKPSINARLRRLKECRTALRESTVRGPDWQRSHERVEERRRSFAAAKERCAMLQSLLSGLERDLRAITHIRELDEIEGELKDLVVPEGFPADAGPAYQKLADDLRRKLAEIAGLEEEETGAQERLKALFPDAKLLGAEETMERLFRGIKSVRDSRRDLPLREAELQRLEEAIASRLRAVRPRCDPSRLEEPDTLAIARVLYRKRLEDWRDLRGALGEARQDADRLEGAGRKHEAALAALRPAPEAELCRRLLPEVVEYEEQRRPEERHLARGLAEMEAEIETVRRRLAPFLPAGATEAETLSVPRGEQIEPFLDEWKRLESESEGLRLKEAELARQRREIERERAVSAGGESIPGDAELARARARRQAGWALVRRAWLQGEDVAFEERAYGHGVPLPEAYEKAVEEADALSDRMREHADEVARKNAREGQARALAVEEGALGAEQERHGRAREEALKRWESLWAPCGIAPGAPAVMQAWLQDHDELAKLCESRSASRLRLAELEAEDRKLESELRAGLGGLDGSLLYLVEQVKAVEARERDRTSRAEQLQETRQADRQELEGVRAKERRLAADLEAAAALLADSLRQLELEETLAPEEAEAILASLEQLRAEAAKAAELRGRVRDMRETIARFEAEGGELVAAVAPDLRGLDAEVAVERLNSRLKESRELRTRRQAALDALEGLERRLVATRSAARQLEAELRAWREKARAADDQQFLETAARASRAAELQREAQRHVGLLARERGAETLEAFRARLAPLDPDSIQIEIQKRRAELEESEQARDDIKGKLAVEEEQFSKLDGNSRAGEVSAEIEAQRVSLHRDIERYAVLALARACLERELKRFEEENQPELLRNASRLFSLMTGGRYERLYRRLEEGETLVAVERSGAERAPDQLSTGTREQLYLALRLSYIAQYGRTAEPLPVVLDDVLVNFDPLRAAATLEALATTDLSAQVLLFTCHDHLVALAKKALPGLEPIELG
jgi:uncharacterized protein YhaN